MSTNNTFPKPDFKVPDGYFAALEKELLKIPEQHPKKRPTSKTIGLRIAFSAAAIVLIAFIISRPAPALEEPSNQEIAVYIETEGAWMLDDLAFDVELAATSFSHSDELDEWNDLLYIEGVDEEFWYTESM